MFRRTRSLYVLFFFSWLIQSYLMATCPRQEQTDSSVAETPSIWVKNNITPLAKLYLHFHQNPELSFEEKETATRYAKELESVGFSVTRNVGQHGVVAIMENGAGPTVMLRADMDALPVTEETNMPYASKVRVKDAKGVEVGVMHACGHDIHMTSMIGAAQFLASHKSQWSGRLMIIGQPAEERGSGAMAMLNDGLFTEFKKPDFAVALHCNSTFASGKVSLRPGYAMANVDSVDVTLYGRGGHGAYPHTTIDPIVQAAKFILDVQTIISREVKPIEAAVITVGSIQAGTKHNIISDSCHMQLTVRSYSDEVRKLLINGIRRKALAAAMSAGAKEPLIEVSEGTPSLSNDPELTQRLGDVFKKTIGESNVLDQEPVMGGEDFSQFGRSGVPGLMYFLGAIDQKRLDRFKELGTKPPSLHSATFYPEIESTLETGVTTMASAALELLKK